MRVFSHLSTVALLGRLAALLLLGLCLLPATPVAAQSSPGRAELQTDHLLVRYPPGEDALAARYAEEAEWAWGEVASLFDGRPSPRVALELYDDESGYTASNPLAGNHGVLAYANARTRSIGVSVSRLARLSETVRQDSLRHELVHLALAELSGNSLSVVWHEGIAQYVERDEVGYRRTALALERALRDGLLLSWDELSDQPTFYRKAPVAYPQSYALVQMLVEAHGFGALKRFVLTSAGEQPEAELLREVFGGDAARLEAELREYLPRFVAGGFRSNALAALDAERGLGLLASGQYAAAREHLERSRQLYAELGSPERAPAVAEALARAERGERAAAWLDKARAAVARAEYGVAQPLLEGALADLVALGDSTRADAAATLLRRARSGEEVERLLADAETALARYQVLEARRLARGAQAASVGLGEAGDPFLARALVVGERADELQARLVGGAVGAGLVVVLGGGLLLRGRRAAAPAQRPRPPEWTL